MGDVSRGRSDAGTRMVPLPQLPAQSEDLEHWLRDNIQQTQSNDGWAAYQRQVLDWCAPFWRPEIVSDYGVLLDRDLWEAWSQHPPASATSRSYYCRGTTSSSCTASGATRPV